MVDKLWAVHVIGPDSIIAQPDRATADVRAANWNAYLERMLARDPSPNDPAMRCEVIEWPGRTEDHAEWLSVHGGEPEDIC